MAYCKNCGAKISDTALFCTACGAPQGKQDAAPAAENEMDFEKAVLESAGIYDEDIQMFETAEQTISEEEKQGFQKEETKPEPEPDFSGIHTVPEPVYSEPVMRQEPQAPSSDTIPPALRPITTAGYLGIFLLMAIPVVNLLLLIIWACGGCRKVNKRNFARAAWILILILFILNLAVTATAFLVLGPDRIFDLIDELRHILVLNFIK